MTDEKLVQNGAPEAAQTNNTNDNSERALVGKIARLPHDIRNELNQWLLDGKCGSEILAWLNELPEVKEILRFHFDGAPITPQNLARWRANGYQCWLKKQEPLAALQELSEDATDIFRAGRGRIANGAATIASGQILEFLRSIPPEKRNTAELAKIVASITTLIKAEQNDARLILAEKRVRQRDEQLLLMRDRDQRDVVATGLRLLGDTRAKAIHASRHSFAQKIELLGRHMFHKLWQPRFVPTSGPEQPAASSPSTGPAS